MITKPTVWDWIEGTIVASSLIGSLAFLIYVAIKL